MLNHSWEVICVPIFTVAEMSLTNRGYFLICHLEFELYVKLLHNRKKQAIRSHLRFWEIVVFCRVWEGEIVTGKAFWRANKTF